MNSRLCHAQVMHARRQPTRHVFRYPLYLYSLDLAELPVLDREVAWFGYNRFRPTSIRDPDYLFPGPDALADKLRGLLTQQGCTAPMSQVQLVTAARCFGHVFNPASFFFCYGERGDLRHLVVQVRNTFGDMHLYVLSDPQPAPAPYSARFDAEKVFHVSPFFPRAGTYEFRVADVRERLDVLIRYRRDGQDVFSARVWGELEPLNSRSLTRAVTRQPLTPLLTLPRIWRQAATLYFGKRLPVFRRPPPADPLTVRSAPPGPVQRLALRAVSSRLERIRSGRLALSLPDGTRRTFGGSNPGPDGVLDVRDFRLFPRLLGAGDIGFGESYVDGEWDCEDLTELLTLLLQNAGELGDHRFHTDQLGRSANFVRHRLRRNTLSQSRANIGAHYDLSNDFYRLFLDPSLTYSCAWYPRADATLEEAQRHKLRRILEKARLREGEHVLEIGCGWGSCALLAATEFGCRVTGITLSREQLALARERVAEAGLEKRVELHLVDYRNVQGQFDKIVSIEMLEAVGHEYLGTFFATCDRLLRPEGLVVLQVITIPDQRYRSYRFSSDWIRKHIFPGGHLPSLAALTDAMTRSSALVVEHLENIGVHYARTLREWRARLESRRDEARALGLDDAFLRKWRYYFSYCEAGFRVRMLNDLQLVLTRPGNPGLPGPPYGQAEP